MLASILFTAVTLAAAEDARALAAAAIEAANEWKLDAADDAARRAYLAALACDDLAAQSLAIDAAAVVARLRGDRDRALDESMLALTLAELSGDLMAEARSYNNLGRIEADLSSDLQPVAVRAASRLRPGLSGGTVYTDDHAPVEWLVDESLVKYAAGGE